MPHISCERYYQCNLYIPKLINIYKPDSTAITYLRFLGGTWYGSYKHLQKKAKHNDNKNSNSNNNNNDNSNKKKVIIVIRRKMWWWPACGWRIETVLGKHMDSVCRP